MADSQILDDSPRYESARQQRGEEKKNLQPPLTPMIDCTFLLLTYFIMTSTFTKDEGTIPGSLPRVDGPPSQAPPDPPIKVVLQARGTSLEKVQYSVDKNEPVEDPKKLFELLMAEKARKKSEDTVVMIKPQGEVRWKYVTEVFNQAVRAKFKSVVFARASG